MRPSLKADNSKKNSKKNMYRFIFNSRSRVKTFALHRETPVYFHLGNIKKFEIKQSLV